VVDLTALALLTPNDGDFFELQDSTGADTDPSITGVPVGLVGAAGLTFRLRYDDPPGEYAFLGYFANDSETRYLKTGTGTVTSTNILDGTIVDADISATAAIDPAKINGTAVITTDARLSDTRTPTDGTVSTAKIIDGAVTSGKIADGTILNSDVNASAAIAGTKVSPDFGSQNVVTTGTATAASLNPTGSSVPTNGVYLPAANSVAISTNGTGRLFVDNLGRTGINTATPRNELEVFGTNSPRLSIRSPEDITEFLELGFQYGTDANSSTNTLALIRAVPTQVDPSPLKGDLLFQTNLGDSVNERLRITSDGRLGLGTSSPGALLDVTGSNGKMLIANGTTSNSMRLSAQNATGTGNAALVFESWNLEYGRFDTSGRLLIGTSTARSNFFNSTFSAALQLEGTGNARRMSIIGNDGQPFVILAREKSGSVGGNTAVSNGDVLGIVSFQGSDGTEFVVGADISAEVDGTPGANDLPTRLVFSTTADGASSPTERMRIANNGAISTVVPGGSTLYPAFDCRAWVNFNGTGTVAIRASGNVSSITDNGTGDYTVNFTTALADANYAVSTTAIVPEDQGSSYQFGIRIPIGPVSGAATTKTASAIRLLSRRDTSVDVSECNVAIFR
jgi:hypothetical protein